MVESAIAGVLGAKESLLKALASTPDDRLLWSPSPTARSPLHIAIHAAYAAKHLWAMFEGTPFPISNPVDADRSFREMEAQFTTRAEAVAMIDEVFDGYVTWLRALPPEKLTDIIQLPFGLGGAPLSFAIGLPAMHTQAHIAQIQYIQTVYGDREWHG